MTLLENPQILTSLITLAGLCLIAFIRLESKVNNDKKLTEQEVKSMKELSAVRLAGLNAELKVLHERITNQSIKHEALEEKILDKLTTLGLEVANLVGYLKRDKRDDT